MNSEIENIKNITSVVFHISVWQIGIKGQYRINPEGCSKLRDMQSEPLKPSPNRKRFQCFARLMALTIREQIVIRHLDEHLSLNKMAFCVLGALTKCNEVNKPVCVY